MRGEFPAFFHTGFDYADFNTRTRAIDVGTLYYAGCYLPVIRGAVLFLCDLANTEGASEGYSVKLLLCRTEEAADKYLGVYSGRPTTNNALIGDIIFQTTPTHCFFWAHAKPYAELLREVAPCVPGWRNWIATTFLERRGRVAAANRHTQAEQERQVRDLKLKEQEDAKAQAVANKQRERDRQRQEKQHLRAMRAKRRADRETLRKHASVCARCQGPILPGEPRFDTPLGFHCKRCGRDGLWATDAVQGKDTKGRNKYRFGYRRADGIWVCPMGYAGGVLRLRHLYNAAPHNSLYWPAANGCYRTSLHQYDHW